MTTQKEQSQRDKQQFHDSFSGLKGLRRVGAN